MSLIRSSIGVTLISLTISIVSFINQLLLANFFGASKAMDLYLLASSIPLMTGGLISSAFSYSLIPHFIKMQSQLGNDYKFYLGQFLKRNVLIATIISVIAIVAFFFLLPFIYTTLNPSDIYQVRIIAFISWCGFIGGVIQSIISCSCNAKKSFYLPLLLAFFPYLFTILLTVFFYKSIGIISVALGVVVGTLVAILLGIYKMRADYAWALWAKKFNTVINNYLKLLRFAILAMLCFTVYQSIDAFWAPRLGPSNLSYLGYCSRILIAFGALIITGPSTVLIPRLTMAIQENRQSDYFNDVSLIIKLVLSLSSVIAVICIVLGKPLIRILFERGAFTSQNTIGINSIIPYMFTGMVFMLCVVVLFRVLFVKEMGVTVAFIGVICAASYFILSGLLSHLMGIQGIALAYLLTWLIIFFISLYILFRQNLKVFFNKNSLIFILKQAFILILIIGGVKIINSNLSLYLKDTNFTQLILHTFIAALSGIVIFTISVTKIIKQQEIIYLLRELKKLTPFKKPVNYL